jgi:hypothetical protein
MSQATSQMATYSLYGALWALVKNSALKREYGGIWDGNFHDQTSRKRLGCNLNLKL